MKIFISQKMRGRPQNVIEVEMLTLFKLWDCQHRKGVINERIHSYNSENIGKDSIELLSHSLAMLAEADIVFVPLDAIEKIKQFRDDFERSQKKYGEEYQHLKGCEFEFLIAKSYGKKVYTYDEAYNFEEV